MMGSVYYIVLIFIAEFVNQTNARNITTCTSKYPLVKNEAYECEILFKNNDGSINQIILQVDVCKDPIEAKFYKKTTIPNSAEVTELSHIFTRLNSKYEQKFKNQVYLIRVDFNDVANYSEFIEVVVVLALGKSGDIIVEGFFSTKQKNCAWVDTLNNGEKVGFIACMIVLFFLLVAIICIIIGKFIKRKYFYKNYPFSQYSQREPVLSSLVKKDLFDDKA
ncbi:uncharacterized protein LOC100201200 isoform X1 [Hydra vulgaris]|uniref:uncharacterized protein LOC100201200 isoform X1 n=1 Tax=Hydra vulgaris TaxID=6087 RepID=UPI0002B4AB84|nr:uncharacterized protein LOC100201200 [Hydra vulgaris]